MVISFNAQHLITSRVLSEDGVDNQADKDDVYCEDKIENLYYVWALVKDLENENPLTGGWKVMEMATRGVF